MNETTRLLQELVALPSVNPMGRAVNEEICHEHRMTDYLERFFRGLGVPYERLPVAPGRENIVARFEQPGPRRTLMLEVHQDTVPVDNMTVAPFGAAIYEGRLYGRGACDVKGGMAAMLTAFARLVREKPNDAMNVVLACSVDEEHTFLGIQKIVAAGVRADMAVVAEPTRLNIVHAHKGVVRWLVSTSGRSCHSSDPTQGVNAIYRMGRVLSAIEQFAERLRQSRTDPLLGPPTLSVGRIEGGNSVNTVPDWCRVEVDRRVIPGEDPLKAPEELRQYLLTEAKLDVPFECAAPWMSQAALAPDLSTELVQKLGRAIDAVKGKHAVMAVPYGTDAPPLAEAGIPAVVFGPGDIAQAHTKDEWIDLQELELGAEIYYRLARCS